MSGSVTRNPATGVPSVDLNLLRTFVAVYRVRSFTAAAHSLGLSQPTVTAQIRALEQHTGRQLFTRLARGVEPTAFGHELAGRVAAPLDTLTAIDSSEALGGRAAPVRLAGPSALLSARVLPALAALVAGGVQLRVDQGATDALLDELHAGQQDLVITTRRPRGHACAPVPLAGEQYILVAAPVWARTVAGSVDNELCTALRRVPLVGCAEDSPLVRRYWRTVFGRQMPPAPPALTVPGLHAVVAAVVAGAGYSVVPRSMCEQQLADGRLVCLGSGDEPSLSEIFLSQRPGADANPDVVRVREALIEAARDWQ